MEKEFDLPCLVENDATSACFGECWLNLGQNYKNVIYMFSGVGCGIMLNGELYRGAKGYAGETSIYNYKEQDAFNCDLGKSCFIKRWEIDLGIAEEATKSYLKENKKVENNIDLKNVFNAARMGDKVAVGTLDQAAKRLGIKIASLVNLLNPEIIVLGGGLEDAGESFLNKVSSTVGDWAFREATEDLKIIYSQLRENAVALGAASLVMQKVFAQL
jgi:glucokinase